MSLLTGCGGGSGGGSGMSITPGNTAVSALDPSPTPTPTPTVTASPTPTPSNLTPMQQVGKALFFDTNLSDPPGESCATCHDPSTAYADPASGQPTSHGAVPGSFGPFNSTFGFRNSPSLSYSQFVPPLSTSNGRTTGGLFLDGRANTLQDQAHGPFLNPFEMGNPDKATVISKVQAASYAAQFAQLFPHDQSNVDQAYDDVASAIAAYEQSPDFAHFSSKYDRFLAGTATLTAQEQRGMQLFNGSAGCVLCHSGSLFTDFSYVNIGVPRNAQDPFLSMPASIVLANGSTATVNPQGSSFQDTGLERTTGNASDEGAFRIPSLRNVAVTGPYMHNGVFQTLQQVVHFYNVRTVDPTDFPAEFPNTADNTDLGNLQLSSDDEAAIVAFLQTLTDDR